eukprot:TRINITY_DN18465_c0_g1_i1.p1 TRINITY_DN18465_c0_g1~~TRINITY_DN18465_c0_g1_i1.p1  ORF type:complete len:494 (+),score=49.93 TRINITY_DN18465_c0_g1_i1:47-1483(+)
MARCITLFELLIFPALADSSTCPGMQYGTPPLGHSDVPSAATYDAALRNLDLQAVVSDLRELFTDSQECWPADYGNYGPLFVRLAWHCSGTYRDTDKRGGCGGGRQRFEPERSWPDNVNLDKARALLWPIKKKYDTGLSWGDLFTLAGTAAIKSMGGPVSKYCAGRVDSPNGTDSLILGPSPEQERVTPCEINGKCERPLGTSTIGLIYVNPEGPVAKNVDGKWAPNPDPAESARDIRNVFNRMGFSDRETVALIGGGHAFGKSHGACPAGAGASPLENATNPWPGLCGTGKGNATFTSGIEGSWTTEPTKWDNEFFINLLKYKWEKHIGPGGLWQWRPVDARGLDAQIMRLTTDVALLHDETYTRLVTEFASYSDRFNMAFDQAWFKLTTDGGYWSNERKCLPGTSFRRMRGDDFNFAAEGKTDAPSEMRAFSLTNRHTFATVAVVASAVVGSAIWLAKRAHVTTAFGRSLLRVKPL